LSKYYQGEETEDDVIWGIRSTQKRDAKYIQIFDQSTWKEETTQRTLV